MSQPSALIEPSWLLKTPASALNMTTENHRDHILPFALTCKAFLSQHYIHFTILPPTAVGKVLHLLYFDLTLLYIAAENKIVVHVVNFLSIRLQMLTTMKERKNTRKKEVYYLDQTMETINHCSNRIKYETFNYTFNCLPTSYFPCSNVHEASVRFEFEDNFI